METLLTAVKPTGTPHLGNYAGAIRPAIEAIRGGVERSVLFVADGHALNSVTDPRLLARHTIEVAATYLACGLPEETLFFRQSDVPEIFELAALLACVCPKGLANRAHAYKAAAARNEEAGREPDAGINMGMFGYPILMAADILAFDTTIVPVGVDQRQHVEIARDIARRMNRLYGDDTVLVPSVLVQPDVGDVPGVDGRKMSKSYGNQISLAATPKELRAKIFSFVTDGRSIGQGAEPLEVPIYQLARAFCTPAQKAELKAALRTGVGFGAVKELAFETINEHIGSFRERFAHYQESPELVRRALDDGAVRAREVASRVLARVKRALGSEAKPRHDAVGTRTRDACLAAHRRRWRLYSTRVGRAHRSDSFGDARTESDLLVESGGVRSRAQGSKRQVLGALDQSGSRHGRRRQLPPPPR